MSLETKVTSSMSRNVKKKMRNVSIEKRKLLHLVEGESKGVTCSNPWLGIADKQQKPSGSGAEREIKDTHMNCDFFVLFLFFKFMVKRTRKKLES